MKTITEDIKTRQFHKCYLLYGDETYLVNQYVSRLKDALVASGDSMNLSIYRGKNALPGIIIDQAETMPFFAEYRVILVEDSGFFKNQAEEMAEYMNQIPDSTIFIFNESQVDGRSKMYKAVKKNGYVSKFDKLKGDMLKKWVLSVIKSEHRNITANALNNFLARTSDDMYQIRNELEKLFSYTLDKEGIEESDVNAICSTQHFDHIFDMVDAIIAGDRHKAVSLYRDLILLKEPVARILYMIGRQYNILFQVKDLRDKGYDKEAIISKMNLHPYVAAKTIRLAERVSRDNIIKGNQGCVNADESYKRGFVNDQVAVESLIIELSA